VGISGRNLRGCGGRVCLLGEELSIKIRPEMTSANCLQGFEY
jgi:hypothetical protein